ncbi:MAG: NAD(P)-dependent oxidoreductase [Verrucomicrobiota bacterium]
MNIKKKKIGFVGVGRMGANMARRLNDKGYKVAAVYDSYGPLAQKLAKELKCEAPQKLADITDKCDIVFTVVTDDRSMRSIFLTGADNLLKNAKDTIFINCATVSPDIHREVTAAAKKTRADVIEACMASSISHAREGKLYLMIGGSEKTYDKVKKLLKDMSVKRRYVGTAGKAAEVKALVNMVMNINTAGLAEGLGLAKALGLDLKMITEVFAQTGANSRVLETDAEDMIGRDHECWFSAAHAAKDSGIAASLARNAQLSLPLNTATKRQYDRMKREGLGELDKSGVAELTFPGRHANPVRKKSPPAKKSPKSKSKAKSPAKSKKKAAAKKKKTPSKR